MEEAKSKKRWLLLILVIFAVTNYAVWLNWSENVDSRLKDLESKILAEPVSVDEVNEISEKYRTFNAVSDRYLCVLDNETYFTQAPDQKKCRADKLPDGWKNLFFSKEQVFDYYNEDISRTGSEIKVWSRMLFNSPQIDSIGQYSGRQNKVEFDEIKSLLVFNCSAREYKNTNIVYLLDGKELLRTTGNRTTVMSNGLTSYSFDDKVEQIEPETFVDALYKEVCHK